jgi:CubicO group peptidase (beta-lactamase class C family)
MNDFQIEGTSSTRFKPVAQAFRNNFQHHGELGSSVAIYYRNELVVDLWGGVRDTATGAPWQEDTITCMMSVAKGVSMICMAMLAERKLLDLDERVVHYWPEFGAEGKAGITIRQALGHLAGIPVTDLVEPGDIYDWQKMVEAIAAQKPLWPAGEVQVYHSSTLGFIAGELLRRITGKSLGSFLREEIQEPLGADYFIGLTEAESRRASTIVASANNIVDAAKREPQDSIAYRMWKAVPANEDYNSSLWRHSEIPSVNGHGTARGVAAIYNAVAAGVRSGAQPLVSGGVLAAFLSEQKASRETAEANRLRMAVGFMLNSPPHRSMGPNMETFGHSGAGGSQSFADPVAELSLCWTTNKMHDGTDTGPRASSIINAAYASIS